MSLAVLLQASTGTSDDEAIEAPVMDRRRQLVLNCPEATGLPLSEGTLVAFRQRFFENVPDRRLAERTVELAERIGGFGSRALRAALDTSPSWGTGLVEETCNMLGYAHRKALGVLTCRQGRVLADVAAAAGAGSLTGNRLKAGLDDERQLARQRDLRILAPRDSARLLISYTRVYTVTAQVSLSY